MSIIEDLTQLLKDNGSTNDPHHEEQAREIVAEYVLISRASIAAVRIRDERKLCEEHGDLEAGGSGNTVRCNQADNPDQIMQRVVNLLAIHRAMTWKKPRYITTADEMEALPSGSAILDRFGGILQRLSNGWHHPEAEPVTTKEAAAVFLPATVIYEPASHGIDARDEAVAKATADRWNRPSTAPRP